MVYYLSLSGLISGERNGNPFQYSCLGNPMDREAWKATVHGVSRVGHDLATKPPPVYLLKKNNNFLVYPCCSIWHCFIIFYGWVIFYCIQVPHLLYLCWGELDCFHVLAVVNSVAPHSSTLAWKIPWMEEPGRLQSMGSLRVRHDWATSLSLFTFMHWRRKWQPTPVFLPGESQGRGSLVGCRLYARTESDTTEAS